MPLPEMVVRQGTDLKVQGIQCLLVHFMVVMEKLDTDHTLLHPLKTLMTTPQHAQVPVYEDQIKI